MRRCARVACRQPIPKYRKSPICRACSSKANREQRRRRGCLPTLAWKRNTFGFGAEAQRLTNLKLAKLRARVEASL